MVDEHHVTLHERMIQYSGAMAKYGMVTAPANTKAPFIPPMLSHPEAEMQVCRHLGGQDRSTRVFSTHLAHVAIISVAMERLGNLVAVGGVLA